MNWLLITRNFVFGLIVLLFVGFTSITVFAQIDHSNFIQNYEGAQTCEACHPGSIAELQDTVHYKFQSSVIDDYLYEEDGTTPHDIEISGKLWKLCGFPTTVPQFNWLGNLADDPTTPHIDKPGGCAKCHIGMGVKPFTVTGFDTPQDSEANNVDCLVCHAENYSRKFYVATVNGEPEVVNGNTVIMAVPKVDGEMDFSSFTDAAKTVGAPKAEYCNRCHAAAGGGKVSLDDQEYSFKRGVQFAPEVDVHAAAGMSCADCHSAGNHKTIRNRNNDIYAYDTEPPEQQMCMNCHGETPHMSNAMYNQHADFISCTACHSVTNGGAVYKDFADIVAPDPSNELGLYGARVDFADETFRMDFLWFDGRVKGEITPFNTRGEGKIYPYKSVYFNQPVDENGHPVPVKWGPIFKTGNVEAGAAAGLTAYTALWSEEIGEKYGLPETPGPMVGYKEGQCGYFSLSHAITKENALTCGCCHSDNSVLDFGVLGYSDEEAMSLAAIGAGQDCSRVIPAQSDVRYWDVFE